MSCFLFVVNTNNRGDYWIGLTDQETEDVFVWTDETGVSMPYLKIK